MSEENKQETSNTDLEGTPASSENDGQVVDKSGQDDQPEMVTIQIPKDWKYNGDRQNAPEPLQPYIKDLDRYVQGKQQELADVKKNMQELEQKLSAPQVNQLKDLASGEQQTATEDTIYTQDEADAIALGDLSVLDKVVRRAAESTVTKVLSEKEKQAKVNSQMAQKLDEDLNTFMKVNPEFKQLLDSPIGEHMIEAARKGLPLEEIYSKAQEVKSYVIQQQEEAAKAKLKHKANGSTVKSTTTGTPDIVWVENDQEARRMSLELAFKNDPRQVKIKK